MFNRRVCWGGAWISRSDLEQEQQTRTTRQLLRREYASWRVLCSALKMQKGKLLPLLESVSNGTLVPYRVWRGFLGVQTPSLFLCNELGPSQAICLGPFQVLHAILGNFGWVSGNLVGPKNPRRKPVLINEKRLSIAHLNVSQKRPPQNGRNNQDNNKNHHHHHHQRLIHPEFYNEQFVHGLSLLAITSRDKGT